MKKYYVMPKRITSNIGSFNFITCMFEVLHKTSYSEIHFDFENTRYIEPNMMAPLGMLFNKLKSQQNLIFLSKLKQSIKEMLVKFDFVHLDDIDNKIQQNFIKYANFSGDEVEEYRSYLYEQLKDIKNNDTISLLITNIMEIFINVKMHARSNINKSRYGNKEVFSSGYYNKKDNYIIFSISNNGWTFTENILKRLNINYSNNVSYIEWAVNSLNSTTDEQRPGGVGLKKLKDLIIDTKGMLVISSGKGFYSLDINMESINTVSRDLLNSFPGTCITVKIPITSSLQNLDEKRLDQISLKDLIMEDSIDVHNMFLER